MTVRLMAAAITLWVFFLVSQTQFEGRGSSHLQSTSRKEKHKRNLLPCRNLEGQDDSDWQQQDHNVKHDVGDTQGHHRNEVVDALAAEGEVPAELDRLAAKDHE